MSNYPFPGGPLTDEPRGGSANDIIDLPPCGGFTPGLHTEEADTIAHYPFLSANRDDTVGGYHLDFGNYGWGGIADNAVALAPTQNSSSAFNYDNNASTPLNPLLNTDFKMTIACGLYVPSIATGSADIVRFQTPGVSSGTAYRVGIAHGAGRVFFTSLGTSGGDETPVSSAVTPLDEWFHFAWTQNAAGTGGSYHVNGVEVDTWTTTLPTNQNLGTARFGIGSSHNQASLYSYYSLIVREKECSTAEIRSMARQVGLV